jgi:hypothetical protein
MEKPIWTHVFNESTLVLEGVTLAEVVEFVVQVLVDLARGTVLHEKTAENTLAAHPENLAVKGNCTLETASRILIPIMGICFPFHIPGHTGILGTLALTETTVSTNSASQVEFTGTSTGVHGDGLADDEAIADQLADGLARVGVGDLAHLIGIEPDLALAAADHGRRKALLSTKVDPERKKIQRSVSR